MSLFKTEELWSIKSGQGETYNTSALCVANFFSNSHISDQIITGSMNGYLRLFSSSQKTMDNKQNSEGESNPFSLLKSSNSMDINIECYLKAPILQLESGKFSNDTQKGLAVLCPNKLLLFEIDESNSAFKIIEEFTLKRVAYNMCIGNFGRVSDREYICVQSTDTTLSFYVNGHLSFSCFLSDYLLPGPIQYLGTDDSIVIVNSNRYFEAYKYKSLAVLNSKNTELSSLKTEKRAISDWNYNIGENALEIKIHNNFILILCRYSIFIFNGQNRTSLKKRFDCRCKLLICYGLANEIAANENEPRYVMSNAVNELMVFQNTTLKWKALMINPNVIDIRVGSFNGLDGFLATLNENGQLAILYLGTDPSINTVMMPSTRESINNSNEDELTMLQRKISTITANNNNNTIKTFTPESSKSLLKLFIDYSSASLRHAGDSSTPEYLISITLKSAEELKNIAVRVNTRPPIATQPKSLQYTSLRPHNDIICRLSFLSTAAMVACSLRASIFATYDSPSSTGCGISQTHIRLPLGLVVSRCAPCKQAAFKVTLDSTKDDIVPLSRLFPEFAPVSDDDQHSNIAIAFRYHSDGPTVTILTSAAAKRYRFQSDHFEAIWLIMDEFSHRLSQHYGGSGGSDNRLLKYSDPLPLDAYFLVLDFHFTVRINLQELNRLLEERSRQFRAIEKLLLTKTKDKSAISNSSGNSLQNIESLLDNSLGQLVQLADLVSEQQLHLAIVGSALCAATSTVGRLLEMSSPTMPAEQRSVLRFALTSDLRDFPPDIGLEELYGQIFAFLLRTGTGGTGKSSLTATKLQLPGRADIDKLKKHITMLCERVAKGAPISTECKSLIDGAAAEQFGGDDNDGTGDRVKSFVTSPRSTNKLAKNKAQKKNKKQKSVLVE